VSRLVVNVWLQKKCTAPWSNLLSITVVNICLVDRRVTGRQRIRTEEYSLMYNSAVTKSQCMSGTQKGE
jgi:hypothetical protein